MTKQIFSIGDSFSGWLFTLDRTDYKQWHFFLKSFSWSDRKMLGHNSFLIKSNLHTICWINDYVKDTSIGLTKKNNNKKCSRGKPAFKIFKAFARKIWAENTKKTHICMQKSARIFVLKASINVIVFFCNISRGDDDNCNQNIYIKYVLSVTQHVMLIQRTHTYRSFSGFGFWVLFTDLKWKDHRECWKIKKNLILAFVRFFPTFYIWHFLF